MRRAVMLAGYAAPAAEAALSGGVGALAEIGLVVGRPVRPMLAASAADVPAAVDQLGPGPLVVDGKLDGIRIQVHKCGDDVRLFTRSLDEVTERLPDVVEAVRRVRAEQVVLDGEAIALDAAGRPRPFQETGARTMSRLDVDRLRAEVPLSTFLFDVLHLGGEDLIDLPAQDRFDRLQSVAPADLLVPRQTARTPEQVQDFFDQLVQGRPRGHRGQGPRGPLRRRSAGLRLDQGEAAPHARPGRSRHRVGQRPAPRAALEHPPRRARPGHRRLRHARQDLQGHDGPDAGLADRALPRPADPSRGSRRARPPRAGRRGGLRRAPALEPLPGRGGPAVRGCCAIARTRPPRRPTPSGPCCGSVAFSDGAFSGQRQEAAGAFDVLPVPGTP